MRTRCSLVDGMKSSRERPTRERSGSAESPGTCRHRPASLILVAAVANLNLSVANVALPSIGEAFDSSQVTLNLIAVGYSLGLAASVLYLGALGDRYGRKLMLVLGTALSIPMSLLAGFAWCDEVLFVARVAEGSAPEWPTRRRSRSSPRSGRGAAGRSRSRCGRRSAALSPPSARS